ncbi:MAG: tetratricopeptide repeat protein [Gallionellaceae bacterium]|nr:MAG: tetratricopeptide repeat protein [Gallionellaceae bacterium]
MNMIKRFSQKVALGALLLCFSLASAADDIQDAGKLFKQGQHVQALEKVDAFLATKPKDAQARFLKGLILTEQAKTAEAIKVFTALTDDYPELPEPYNNLAVLYAGQGQYEKAKVALEMAIRTHPSYATAHENLGDIYAKMASQAYDRALQLDKSNTSTQTKLEMIKDLFGGNARSGRITPASRNVATGVVSAPKPSAVVANAPATPVAASTPAPTPAAVAMPAPSKPLVAFTAPGPAKAPAAEQPSANANEEVLKTVREWAAAWSAQNSKKYLAFYAKEFKTPGGESRSAWEAQRQERIAKPKSIHVEVKNARVKLIDDGHAAVSFKQFYRASHLHTSASKTMELVKNNGKWLIAAEHAGK